MGLREDNPLVDSDLELIITAFEKAMVQSRDVDSVFVPFRREMLALSNYPSSIVGAIDSVPIPSESEESTSDSPGTGDTDSEDQKRRRRRQRSPAMSSTPEAVVGSPMTPIEDGDDAEEWTEKAKDWVSECIPCLDRTLTTMDADFFADLGIEWDNTLNDISVKLTNFEDFFTGSEEDLLSAFCDLGDTLKDQCGPDIRKMIFVLSMMLDRMQIEFSFDLGIIDSFLMSALSPLFNQLASMLENIVDLALDPIRCVLDYIQWQINNSARLAEEARESILHPVRQEAYNARKRMFTAQGRNARASVSISIGKGTGKTEAEIAAERARLEEQYRQSQARSRQQMKSALARANNAFDQTREAINYLERFKEYLLQGVDYLEDKKDWLLNLIEEFISGSLDKWDANMNFARGKSDLLTMLSILQAMFDTVRSGDISCGPESDGMTKEDVQRIVRRWQHPSESLEITVEDGNIVTRRLPDVPSTEEAGDPDTGRGIITGSTGADGTDGTNGTGEVGDILSNIVARRAISSCLKKVTTDEADQVNYWIRQLEQEV